MGVCERFSIAEILSHYSALVFSGKVRGELSDMNGFRDFWQRRLDAVCHEEQNREIDAEFALGRIIALNGAE